MSSKRSAICLSGQIRHLHRGYDAIYKNVIEPNSCDVFIHTWVNTSEEGDLYHCARKLYNAVSSHAEPQIHFDTRDYDAGPYADGDNRKRVFNIHSMWYSINRSYILSKMYSATMGFDYDWVARCRFDWGPDVPIIFEKGDPTAINAINDCTHTDTCLTDHFAFSNDRKMQIYTHLFHSFEGLHKRGIPFCSEILLGQHLIDHKVNIAQIDAPRQFILH